MEFYQSIAKYYDYIFPYNPFQLDFVKSCIDESFQDKTILDIGSGTGNLTNELSKLFQTTVGIDLNQEMLNLAQMKYKQQRDQLSFMVLNMQNIENQFSESSFDTVICFGNTLVHLNNIEEIKAFLIGVRKVLKSGGKFLLQIINYERILDKKIPGLSTIENDRVKFERNYKYIKDKNIIEFETILSIKDENKVIKNQIELYPLQLKELHEVAKSAGFNSCITYGSFKKDSLTMDSIHLIAEIF